jgi:hypothetical protein
MIIIPRWFTDFSLVRSGNPAILGINRLNRNIIITKIIFVASPNREKGGGYKTFHLNSPVNSQF